MPITSTPTWKKLEHRWDLGFEKLLPEEQEAIALWWLEAETMNGGLDQFFWNNAGEFAMIALAGLSKLDAPITKKALESALQYFGDTYPIDRNERMRLLEEIENKHGTGVFTVATRVIQDLPERFVEAAVERLEKHYCSVK